MVSRRAFVAGGVVTVAGLGGCIGKTISKRDASVPPSETLFTDVEIEDGGIVVSVNSDLKMEIGSKYNGTAEVLGINVPKTGYTRYTQAFLGSSRYRFELAETIPEKLYCIAKSKTGKSDDYMQAERVTVEIDEQGPSMVSGHEYRKNYIITD